MHRFFIKTPWWARRLFPAYVWRLPEKEKVVYLTFDDGPHPEITPWVLAELKKFNAKATFFCIGANVLNYPETFKQILEQGHSIGNHTQRHLNGWKVNTAEYLNDVVAASKIIHTNLFRPPYGKIRSAQARGLKQAMNSANAQVVMWDVLSADFDLKMSPGKCQKNLQKNIASGSIVVFHDSEKAFRNLAVVLPATLKYLEKAGYRFGKIPIEGF